MALLSLKKPSRNEPLPALNLRACHFERARLGEPLTEGGIVTCRTGDGREWTLRAGVTWDALGMLRAELARNGIVEPDEAILRAVLRHWAVAEFKRRLEAGWPLPAEALVLDDLGGPAGCRPRHLLQACGLLPGDAA